MPPLPPPFFYNNLIEFLLIRQQRVVIGKHSCKYRHFISGVPYRSVLGPLLFMLCIHDMWIGVENMFADFSLLGHTLCSNMRSYLRIA